MQKIGGAVEDNKIIIWHEMDGAGDSSHVFIEKICQEINEKYGVEFDIKCMNISPYIERLKNLDKENEKPDVIFIPQDFVSVEEFNLAEVPSKYQDYMDRSIWDSMKYKGVQRGVPYARGNHAVLFYNKKYFKKAPENFEEIKNLNEILNDKVNPFAIDLEVAYWLLPFIYTIGKNPIEEGRFYISEENEKKVIDFFDELIKKRSLCSCEAISTMLEDFLEGKIASMINGEWLYEYLLKEMGDDLGVAELPQIGNRAMTGVKTSVGIAFPWDSVNGRKSNAIDIFIRYMLSEDVQRRWFTEYHRFPVNNVISKELETKDLDENMKASLRQMQKNVFLQNDPCIKDMWTGVDKILAKIRKIYDRE